MQDHIPAHLSMEVVSTLKELKYRKTAGVDEVYVEMINVVEGKVNIMGVKTWPEDLQ